MPLISLYISSIIYPHMFFNSPLRIPSFLIDFLNMTFFRFSAVRAFLIFAYIIPINSNFAKKYVFLGYSFNHQGYHCLDISTGCVYLFRHIVFDEHAFSFQDIPYEQSLPNIHPNVFILLVLIHYHSPKLQHLHQLITLQLNITSQHISSTPNTPTIQYSTSPPQHPLPIPAPLYSAFDP